MNALEVVEAYVASRRALGTRLDSGAKVLRQFVRATGNLPLSDIRPEAVDTFLRGDSLSATWRSKRSILAGLFRYAIARGYVSSSPLPVQIPKLPPPQTPYVYSTSELQRLLDATTVLHHDASGLQAATYRTLFLLLYGSGLRVGEAIGLTISDVDLGQRVLTVRNTKFYKTRIVPVGPRLTTELATYVGRRSALRLPLGADSAFFCTRTGHCLSYPQVIALFQRVRSAAGIGSPPGEPRPPRLHDLRHTAAVHRLLAWYRADQNVQRLLPKLATYLGHADIRSTQVYLKMTPELLQEAGRRFAMYAQQETDHA